MKALFLGTLAASQATPIIKFITADIRTEILDNGDPAQAAAALADADVLLTGAWRSGYPPAPKLRLLQVPLAGTDGIDVSALPKGVTLCNAYGHEPALGEFAIMMMLAWRHRLFDIATSFREGSWYWSPMVGGAVRGEIGGQTVGVVGLGHIGREVAWRAAALGCRVLAANRTAREKPASVEQIFPMGGTRPDARRMRHRRAQLRPNRRDDRADRRAPACRDEAQRLPDQSGARPDRRRGGALSRLARWGDRRSGARHLVALSERWRSAAAALALPVPRTAERDHDAALLARGPMERSSAARAMLPATSTASSAASRSKTSWP